MIDNLGLQTVGKKKKKKTVCKFDNFKIIKLNILLQIVQIQVQIVH